ncbi:hypothetical protein OSB04_005663 [Centaurea solstitialis]|uniref:Uncharacterized protein n=1 Tax=Centaurea solstitialis TaxID=347529 RepID=A0AA38TGG7_9ASTR|nr:hypothetical protein OSB04_005663 [Centaurea solstitialis]
MAPEASASITPASSKETEENPSRTTTYHPALTVSNIKSFIPIVLEIEKVQYTSWAELFKIHAKAFLVIDHIVPPRDSTVEPALWSRLDAVVLEWIYGTISNDLLHTILEPDSTAQVASESRLVLQLVAGLTEAYDGVATIILLGFCGIPRIKLTRGSMWISNLTGLRYTINLNSN